MNKIHPCLLNLKNGDIVFFKFLFDPGINRSLKFESYGRIEGKQVLFYGGGCMSNFLHSMIPTKIKRSK